MSGQIRTLFYLAILVSISSAESPQDACSKDGDMLGMVDDCRKFLKCEMGQYVTKDCGFWQEFDIKLNECRWAPLATCRQKTLDDTVLADATKMTCTDQGPCTGRQSTSVEGECQYYCSCKDKKFQNPKKCLLDNYYDSRNHICTPDSSVCQYTPTAQPTTTKPTTTVTTTTKPTTTVTTTTKPTTTVTKTTKSSTVMSTSQKASTSTTQPSKSDCDKPGEKKPDTKDCHKYYECTAKKKWKHEACIYTRYYDVEKKGCAFNIAFTKTFPWYYHPCQ